MRRTTIHLLTIVLLLFAGAAGAVFAGGCGGDDEQAAFEQYLSDVRPALDESLAGLEALATGLEAASQTDPPDFAVAGEGATEASRKWASAQDTVEAITPPEDLKAANDSLAKSLGLQTELYGEMGSILTQAATAVDDPTLMAELATQLGELDPDAVGDEVRQLTADWGNAVQARGEELGVEPPQWLEDWSDAIDETGERLQSL